MSESVIPFGMLFVEEDTDKVSETSPEPTYDPKAQLSFVTDNDGNSVPFVIWGWNALSGTKTGQSTKASLDQADTDVWSDGIWRME